MTGDISSRITRNSTAFHYFVPAKNIDNRCFFLSKNDNAGNVSMSRRHLVSQRFLMLLFQLMYVLSMMTSSNGNIFRVTGHLCGEFTRHRWIPRTKASDAEPWCFLHLNKRLNKQSWGWWFEMPSCPLWRHCNVNECAFYRSRSLACYIHRLQIKITVSDVAYPTRYGHGYVVLCCVVATVSIIMALINLFSLGLLQWFTITPVPMK